MQSKTTGTMLSVLVVTILAEPRTSTAFGLAKGVTEQKMQELIIAVVLIAIVLIAVLVSWISGKRSGVEEQQLKDTIDHQTKTHQAMLEQQKLDRQLAVKEFEIMKRQRANLTPENVDKLLKKYRKMN